MYDIPFEKVVVGLCPFLLISLYSANLVTFSSLRKDINMESRHWKYVANLFLYLALITASLLQLKGVFQLYFSHLTTSSFFREPAEDGKVHTKKPASL